ncbi:MAG: acyl-CoA dehydrogenase family protein [Pseudomonadales bacterium]
MEFGLSEEQKLLQDSLTRFLKEQVSLDHIREVAAGESNDAMAWSGLSELGIPGLIIPESHGGVGLGMLDAVVVAEALGYHITPGPFISTAVIAPTMLMAAGQTERLTDVAAGQYRIGVALSEAIGSRLDAGISVTDGTATGKALFALDSEADSYLINGPDHSLYWVDAGDPGFSRKLLTTIDKTRTICELQLNKASVQLVSADPGVLLAGIDAGRVIQAADSLGAAQCMLDQAVAYSLQREQFNRVIASFQAVKHMCAEMASQLEPCRSLVWYAGHAMATASDDARLTACHAKAHLSEVAQFVARTSTEVHGGMGFTDLVGLHYWFKRIGANRQLLGSPELVREEAARAQNLVA